MAHQASARLKQVGGKQNTAAYLSRCRTDTAPRHLSVVVLPRGRWAGTIGYDLSKSPPVQMVTWDRMPPEPENASAIRPRVALAVWRDQETPSFQQVEALRCTREAERDTTVSLAVSTHLHTWIARRMQGTASPACNISKQPRPFKPGLTVRFYCD